MTDPIDPAVVAQEYDAAIPVRRLKEHPQNPRQGDDDIVNESIEALGFFGAVYVQRSTRHVIAGNTRLRVMRKRKAKTLPGFWIDCDDDTALRILLMDNRSSDMAKYDDALLIAILSELESFDGTGYTDIDLAALMLSQEAEMGGDGFRDSLDTDDDTGGDLLALADVTLGEPDTIVEAGDVWLLSDRHLLIHCDLMTGWSQWLPFLEQATSAHTVFLPYPGPYVAASVYQTDRTFIMVQPNAYLTAHIVDKWIAVFGPDSAVKQ